MADRRKCEAPLAHAGPDPADLSSPQSLTSAQGPVNQRQVSSQGPKLQARMSVGRLPRVQLCTAPPAPASAGPVPSASPLPRHTTERRWIPVPHSAEH